MRSTRASTSSASIPTSAFSRGHVRSPFVRALYFWSFQELYLLYTFAMASTQNPFTPGFGEYPPVLVGRTEIIGRFEQAFDHSHPYRRSVISAARGSGKTVLLDAIQDVAASKGWLVVQQDAGTRTSALGERVIDDCRQLSTDGAGPDRRRTGTSVKAFGVSASADWEYEDDDRLSTVRTAMRTVLERRECSGLLLTVDEVHEASKEEIHEVGNAVQHLMREGFPVAFVGAGLPVPAANEPTFLRRCKPIYLDATDRNEVRHGLVDTASLAHWTFTDRALDHAVEVSAGLPYMMQLVGFEALEEARATSSSSRRVGAADTVAAIERASRELALAVSATLDVSKHDMRFLLAMAIDDGVSATSEIGSRLSRDKNHVNVYRGRLIDAGLIVSVGHGRITFVEPWMRSLLRSLPVYGPFKKQAVPIPNVAPGYRLDASIQAPTPEH